MYSSQNHHLFLGIDLLSLKRTSSKNFSPMKEQQDVCLTEHFRFIK
jgi:hypothetical protein